MEIKYLSAEKYAETVGLGVQEVKKLCKTGQLEHFVTEGGHYKIKLILNAVPKEQYDKLNEKYIRLKTILENAKILFKEVKTNEN